MQVSNRRRMRSCLEGWRLMRQMRIGMRRRSRRLRRLILTMRVRQGITPVNRK
jgi:hypothetical protein